MRSHPTTPLAQLTTLRLGGPADELLEVHSESELLEALRAHPTREVLVLGGGSNLVVGDAGFRGVVLQMKGAGVDVARDGDSVRMDVWAGEPWHDVVARSASEGWGGLECLAGIPGLTGATPIQNVGAYGQQVSDTIEQVRAYDRELGEFVEWTASECRFGYRDSLFKRTPSRYIVTRVRFRLLGDGRSTRADYAELARYLGVAPGAMAPQRAVFEAVIALRRSKGMVLSPDDPESVSAGSFFVNPTVSSDVADRAEALGRASGVLEAGAKMPRFPAAGGAFKLSAAWLIERGGFPKGTALGAFRISRKHSLALVHAGGGTTAELLSTARRVRDGVRGCFQVTLTPEPVMVGCSWDE